MQTNFGDTVIGFPLTGYQTLDNGLNFIGVQAGGDWEYPVFFIFYWDGEKLRGYIPHYGNPVNLDLMMAFGSEDYYGIDEKKEESIKKQYKERGLLTSDDPDFESYDIEYLKKYKMKDWKDWLESDLGYNWDAIEKDIMAAITVE